MAFEGLDGIVEAHRRTDAVPGLSVAVAMGGRVRWLRGFGMADLAAGSRARPETAYLWFSMTKIVTATAVMRLAERGVIDLDAPVTDYVPPFAAVRRAAAVTVRHLLSHSSGLANPVPVRWVHAAGIPGPDARAFVERLLARHRTLKFRPGERARYSNLGYLVLGEAVANVTGVPFTDAVRALVLDPLGMRHTGFTYEECGGAAATGYQRLAAPLTPLLRAVLPAGIVGGRHGRRARSSGRRLGRPRGQGDRRGVEQPESRQRQGPRPSCRCLWPPARRNLLRCVGPVADSGPRRHLERRRGPSSPSADCWRWRSASRALQDLSLIHI